MNDHPLRETRDPRGVVTLTLNDPARHNALSPALIAALSAAFDRLADDGSCRVVCLWGAGQSFCAGGDLAWMQAQIDASREERITEAGKLASLLARMNHFPKPLVGCVAGNAFGGGIGLMAVCDEVLVQAGARFGLTEARLGLIPATISPYVVARIGGGAARRLFLSARLFDCDEALRIGLVAAVASAEDFAGLVESRIAAYLAASPQAMRAAKSLISGLMPPVDDATIAGTIEALADCWEQADAREGVAAFFDRRQPAWRQ